MQSVDSTMTIDPLLPFEDWSPPLRLQFDDNFAQGASPESDRGRVAGILYLKATPIRGGGPQGDGLVGTLLQRYAAGAGGGYQPTPVSSNARTAWQVGLPDRASDGRHEARTDVERPSDGRFDTQADHGRAPGMMLTSGAGG